TCRRLLSRHALFLFFLLRRPPPPTSTLFPYTTLFRSLQPSGTNTQGGGQLGARRRARRGRRCRCLNKSERHRGQSWRPIWCSMRSEEHTSELQSLAYLVCRLLLEKKNKLIIYVFNTHD